MHAAFVETLGEKALWRRYLSGGGAALRAPETAN
jgi:hypothetical protein